MYYLNQTKIKSSVIKDEGIESSGREKDNYI